ncbi:MAG: histidine--tRNA ligase [Candidatus Magasanikbacteria bacterium]
MPPKKKTAKKTTAKKKNAKNVTREAPAKKKPVGTSPTKPKLPVTESKSKKKNSVTPQILRGMKDVLPKDEFFWKNMREAASSLGNAYNFKYIETPILESASLFVRSIGIGTDVVSKEMYVFEDKDGSRVALRPENTASVVRSYITHGMQALPQPVKVWYYGSMFRHDRPQAGRFRQFHQFGCETLGKRESVIDAELISVAYNFLKDLGIDTHVHVNSIGSVDERQNYIIELVAYLRSKRVYLCDDCKKKINKNPLRTLDCKKEQCQPVKEEAPQIIDWLKEESKEYFMRVLEFLDELDIPYVLDSTLVRGLDYYTDTVFELFKSEEEGGSQSALGGGGRYDLLAEHIGGPPTAGCGFSIGLERVLAILRKNTSEEDIVDTDKVNIFFAQLGTQGKQRALALIEELRKEGIYLYHALGKGSLKGQLEMANAAHVTHSIILGQKEVQDGTLIIRDMDSGIQEIIDQRKLKKELGKIIK